VHAGKEIFYIPNLVSIFRLVLLIPVCYLLLEHFESKNTLIIILVLCMYFSDLLDGFLARRLNQISEAGKIIDPLADKISVAAITLILIVLGKIPLWFALIVLIRDVLIFSFGLYLNKKRDVRLMSNIPGKLAVFTIGLVLLLAIVNTGLSRDIMTYMIFISLALIIYSSYLYFIRFRKAITI